MSDFPEAVVVDKSGFARIIKIFNNIPQTCSNRVTIVEIISATYVVVSCGSTQYTIISTGRGIDGQICYYGITMTIDSNATGKIIGLTKGQSVPSSQSSEPVIIPEASYGKLELQVNDCLKRGDLMIAVDRIEYAEFVKLSTYTIYKIRCTSNGQSEQYQIIMKADDTDTTTIVSITGGNATESSKFYNILQHMTQIELPIFLRMYSLLYIMDLFQLDKIYSYIKQYLNFKIFRYSPHHS